MTIDVHGSRELYGYLFTKDFDGEITTVNSPFCRGLIFNKKGKTVTVAFGTGGFYPDVAVEQFNKLF